MLEQLAKSNEIKIHGRARSNIGVVLCHGFLSKHEQMVPMSNYIYETLGWETSLVELTGHGYDEDNITSATWDNWVDDVRDNYVKLKERCDKVFLVGFSLGGCVSSYIASMKSIEPAGLVIINGVFGVKNVFNKLLPGVMVYNKICKKLNLQKFMLESIENNSESPDLNQSLISLSATNELRKMSKISRTVLPDILCPTLIIQEYNDPTVFYGSGVRAFKRLGSTLKKFHKTKLNTHLTIYDRGMQCNVFCKISEFLKEVVDCNFVNIAHRGASGNFTENTLTAFENAIEHGCDMIELDVQKIGSKYRVFHDYDFNRMFGLDINTKDMSEEQVSGLVYPNLDKIPTLEEVLDVINGRVSVNVEVKGPYISTSVGSIVSNYLENPVWDDVDIIISSFSCGELNLLRRTFPDLSLSLLVHDDNCDNLSMGINFAAAKLGKFHSLNIPLSGVSSEVVELSRLENIKIYVYTVNTLDDIRGLREMGVSGVFTDFPKLIR
jgi:glycerophosphoryl diester phosphodiesterase